MTAAAAARTKLKKLREEAAAKETAATSAAANKERSPHAKEVSVYLIGFCLSHTLLELLLTWGPEVLHDTDSTTAKTELPKAVAEL